jgi:WD40 repeat protein
MTLKGHTGPVTSASFSPDGSRIVTASWDNTAKVWDMRPINREFLPRDLTSRPRAVR